MAFLQTWRESLKFFIPKNFKLFFLVTLKTVIETYKILITRFWPLLLIWASIYCFLPLIGQQHALVALIINYVMYAPYLFLCFLIIRPSIKLKNFSYIKEYGIYFIEFLFLFLLYRFVVFTFPNYVLFLGLTPIFVSPFFIFWTLFVLDSEIFNPVTAWQALKMVWYNLPFCVISYVFFACISAWNIARIPAPFSYFHLLFEWPLFLFFVPIPLCWFAIFYTKQVHAQFQLYMPAKKQGD